MGEGLPYSMWRIEKLVGYLNVNFHLTTFCAGIFPGVRHRDRAVELAAAEPYPNPRAIEAGGIRALLEAAFEGRAPRPSSSAPS